MGFEVAKAELEALAQEKLDDAVALIADSRWSNGYYLAGYAVELALKACIAKEFKADTIPDRDIVNSTYSHKLSSLIGIAGLSGALRSREQIDPNFAANWGVVTSWSPNARYGRATQQQAEELLRAIGDQNDGVFVWIKAFW